jgi:solute carrier family 25 phosphate transporter 3
MAGWQKYNAQHYVSCAFGGAVCCSVTHGATTPIDVIKTRIQLEPQKYTEGFIGTMRSVMKGEGAGALFTGATATAQGYFVQGWFKFGGVEIATVEIAKRMDEHTAYNNRIPIKLVGAACAELIADIFLCPFEACRIRAVSDPTYASGMVGVGKRMVSEMGVVGAFYSGLGPILLKQIPYTMAKFAVQQQAAEVIYNSMGTSPDKCSGSTVMGISLTSGVAAGIVAATISQPADGLLSKINKKGAGGEGGIFVRLGRLAAETGFKKLCLEGLPARWVHVGVITAGQFAIVDLVMMSVGASRFHFHKPATPAAK